MRIDARRLHLCSDWAKLVLPIDSSWKITKVKNGPLQDSCCHDKVAPGGVKTPKYE